MTLGLALVAAVAWSQTSGYPGYGDPKVEKGYPGYGGSAQKRDHNEAKGFPSWGSGAKYLQGTSQSTVWRTYSDGALSSIAEAGTRVIRNEAEWSLYWRAHRGDPRALAPRDVDWSKEQIVAIHLGARPTSGYSVLVEGLAWPKPNQAVVKYVERTPNPDSMLAQVITSPFTIIRMQRTSAAVAFQKRTVQH